MLFDVEQQQAQLKAACHIEGTVEGAHVHSNPVVVVLLSRAKTASAVSQWQVADHFVTAHKGGWEFVAEQGSYRVAAFEDANRDLVFQPGESFARAQRDHIECMPGERFSDLALVISSQAVEPAGQAFDVAALQAQSTRAGGAQTLGQLTAAGEVATLADARFSEKRAEESLWRPYDFILTSRPGVYFLEEFDARKIPVLFVHGINGTPANFSDVILNLDRSRFQPWVYSYPSGIYLTELAEHLTQTIAKIELRYSMKRIVVVAHSMGGLLTRGFLLRHMKQSGVSVPLFVSISTPWDGHRAAQFGVDHAPVIVDVWRDLVPGSAYLESIFAEPLPQETRHELIFTFERNGSSFGESDDGTVSLASQLAPSAQQAAARVYGIDDDHVEVLKNQRLFAYLNEQLSRLVE